MPNLSTSRLALYLLIPVAAALALPTGDSSATSPAPEAPPPPTAEEAPPPPAAPTPADRLRQGIDVSRHSGTVDFAAVAQAGYGFAFAKATEGMDLKDIPLKLLHTGGEPLVT